MQLCAHTTFCERQKLNVLDLEVYGFLSVKNTSQTSSGNKNIVRQIDTYTLHLIVDA